MRYVYPHEVGPMYIVCALKQNEWNYILWKINVVQLTTKETMKLSGVFIEHPHN